MNKKRFVATTAVVSVLALIIGVAISIPNKMRNNVLASNTFTLKLDENNGAAGSNAKTEKGFEVEFATSKLTEVEGKYGALAAEGYIELAEGYHLNNLQSIRVESSDNAALLLSYGFESGNYVRRELEGWIPVDNESILGEHPNTIRFDAKSDVVIESISLTYASDGAVCNTPTATPAIYTQNYGLVGQGFDLGVWDPANAIKIELNSYNKNTDFAEYMVDVTFGEGAKFKVLNGLDWGTFDALSVDQTEGTAFAKGQLQYNGAGNDIVVKAPGDYKLFVKHFANSAPVLYVPESDAEIPTVEEYEVFCYAPNDWTTVYMHAWAAFGASTTWPGMPMTRVDGNLWKISVPEKTYEFCLFHNNAGLQGPDTTLPTKDDGNKYYHYDTALWSSATTNPSFVNTSTTIGSYKNLGCWQYGGAETSWTNHEYVTSADHSKETDSSALKVSVNGDGGNAGRIYSSYFQLNQQKTLSGATQAYAISFWVYNVTVGGGLLFKANGVEITDIMMFDVFDANNNVIKDNSRDLNYTGFHRYQIILNDSINAGELEIGIWGASSATCIYLSNFQFIQNV